MAVLFPLAALDVELSQGFRSVRNRQVVHA